MKRFCIKFFLLFIIIDGFVGVHYFFVQPNLTGDMGKLGQIPFGQEYNKRIDAVCQHKKTMVENISPQDSITSSFITIGDSFSQRKKGGYSQFLAELLHENIQNIQHDETPEQTLFQMLNHHQIPSQTTVILEIVERNMVNYLCWMNFEDTRRASFTKKNETYQPNKQRELQDALQFLKKNVGIRQPVLCYSTTQELFTHTSRHNKLYIYDSPWDHDGDLRFPNLTEKDIFIAYQNLYVLHQLAESQGINLLVVIAADKYDVYEPFITTSHPKNHTLDHCPEEPWIVNTQPILQAKAWDGVKDIYYINDTHWSPVGAKIAAEEIYQRLQPILK